MAGAEEKTRSGTAGLRYLSLIAATLAPTPAIAGAWVAPEQQFITTSFYGELEDETAFEASIYNERPIERETSVVATTWFTRDITQQSTFRGEASLGLKQQIFENDDWVVAAQGSALWQSEPGPDCGEAGGELRVLAGRSLSERTFLNTEVALREYGGSCGATRFDVTAGWRPNSRWLALGQVFYDAPDQGEEVIRAQVTLVRFLNSGRGIQIGVRSRIDGEADEVMLVLGSWGRRGD